MGKNEKNFIIAIVLCLAVMFLFQTYLMPKVAPVPPQAPGAVQATAQGANTQPANSAAAAPIAAVKQEIKAKKELKGKDVVMETEEVKAVFDTRGASLKSWELKKYKTDGKNTDLVWQQQGAEGYVAPMTLSIPELEFDDNTIYSVSGAGEKLEFTVKEKNGAVITKTYTLSKNFRLDCEFGIKYSGKNAVAVKEARLYAGTGFNNYLTDKTRNFNAQALTDISYINKKVVKVNLKDLAAEKALAKEIKQLNWAGMRDKFFASLVIVDPAANFGGFAGKVSHNLVTADGAKIIQIMPVVSLVIPEFKAGEGSKINFSYYSGPLLYENLEAMKNDLFKALDYGFFGWLGILFLKLLKFFYGIVGNWGVAIILLSLAIKAVTWWPTQVSYRSMKKMQEVQPHVNALKEQYKNDPAKMNTEMMRIYKEKKVNPVSGCLPMLLTMPVLFALYAILVNAIELKDSPFYFWLTDLSGPDPIWVLPIMMGATMWVQQKMTPSTDPQQAKIFLWMMPIMFTGMSIWFAWPSGLVLFWFVQNIVSIVQQYMTNKSAEPTV